MYDSMKFACTLAIAVATAAPAWAGGPVQGQPAAAPAAPAAPSVPVLNWAGPYAFLGIAGSGGTARDSFSSYNIDNGAVPSASLGYNMQQDAWVYGLELTVSDPIKIAVNHDGAPGIGTIYDLSGRAGYAVGNALYYGKLGYAATTYDNSVTVGDLRGFAIGAGVDYLVGARTVVGAYVTQFSTKTNAFSGARFWHVVAGLRIGYKF